MLGGGSCLSEFTVFDHAGSRCRPPLVQAVEAPVEGPCPKVADRPAEVRSRGPSTS